MNKQQAETDTLVALINNQRDLDIAVHQNWYRIPVKTKIVPKFLRDGKVQFISFYFSGAFKKHGFRITHYAEVKNISIVKRSVLLPDEEQSPKANEDYYKIEFGELKKLSHAVHSLRKRRILFISTVFTRLLKADEINDLYVESPLEEKLWEAFKKHNIDAERQFFISSKSGNYILDFALFCSERNINVECDGDTFHLRSDFVKKDKIRNNALSSLGWSVLRYTSSQICEQETSTIAQIKDTINRYGGIKLPGKDNFKMFVDDTDQLNIF